MAYLNLNVAASARVDEFNLGPGWVFSEFKFGASPTVTTGDVIDMFFDGNVQGYFVADWVVFMEQVDTNVSPTVQFHIGVAGSDTGISGTTGLRWESSVADLGRIALGSSHRATNAQHLQQNGHGNRIGLQCSVLPATAAWANKRIWMGLLLLPNGSMG